MAILIDKETRILIQGITGNEALFHANIMLKYPLPVVAGVNPGKGGDWVLHGKVPVYDIVKNAVAISGANTSIIFVPAHVAADAIMEAVDAGIRLIVCVTDGIPVHDMMKVKYYIRDKDVTLIGPNSPGLLIPDVARIGVIPPDITFKGNIGLVSRSGTLTYEIASLLRDAGIGTSACVGIGADPVLGTGFAEILDWFDQDSSTEKIVLVGEVGGYEEQSAANAIINRIHKPVVAFVAGQTAPRGVALGHAGAIIEHMTGTAQSKMDALREAGAKVAVLPEEIPDLLK